ncbi:MAG TPA: hypothetical protein VGK99_03880 [Acidobacteriota bacterium]
MNTLQDQGNIGIPAQPAMPGQAGNSGMNRFLALMQNPAILRLLGQVGSNAAGPYAGQAFAQQFAQQQQLMKDEEDRRLRRQLALSGEKRAQDAEVRAGQSDRQRQVEHLYKLAVESDVEDATDLGQSFGMDRPTIAQTNAALKKFQRAKKSKEVFVNRETGEVGLQPGFMLNENAGKYITLHDVEKATSLSEKIQDRKSREQIAAVSRATILLGRNKAVPASLAKAAGLGEEAIDPERTREITLRIPKKLQPVFAGHTELSVPIQQADSFLKAFIEKPEQAREIYSFMQRPDGSIVVGNQVSGAIS